MAIPLRARIGPLLALPLALGVACGGDPIVDKADKELDNEQVSQQVGAPGAHPPQVRPPVPVAGVPEEPAPGVPGEPEPVAAGAPDGGVPGPPEQALGPSIVVSGEVRYEDWTSGEVRVDVFDGDQRDFSARPSLVAMETLQSPGAFEIRIPQGAGDVWISAFNDTNENGRPDHEDPVGFYSKNPLTLKGDAIEGVVVELELTPPPPDRM